MRHAIIRLEEELRALLMGRALFVVEALGDPGIGPKLRADTLRRNAIEIRHVYSAIRIIRRVTGDTATTIDVEIDELLIEAMGDA